MEQIKKIGQLCRQHYEKMILIIVLILLAGAVWYLYQASQDENEKVRQMAEGYQKKAGKPITPVSPASFDAALKMATNPPALNYSGNHNLFNPVKWQMNRANGQVIKVTTGTEIGAGAMQVSSISPLQLTIAFDAAALFGSEVTGYRTVVTNEATTNFRLRRIPQFISMNANNVPKFSTNSQVFILSDVKGPPEEPTELVAVLKDFDNEKISFAPGKPYSRTVGYEAEMKYPPTGKVYQRLRKDSPIDIEGEPYKVVDIIANRVVLSDDSNGKRYTIDYAAAP